MVALDIQGASKALAVVGGYIVFFGLVSHYVKEKLYISEALVATIIGILFGPALANVFSPSEWTSDPNKLSYEITRVVIGIQVLFTGISLPAAYTKREWKSLAVLLGPIMTIAWMICSLLVWGLIPGLTFLESLVIGACVTPTDPVLANSICKGGFAENNVPLHVRELIVAESGANDGLGFPFLFIPVYLILLHTPTHPVHTVGGAIGEWFYNIVLYQVLLSCVIGIIIGYVGRKILYFAREKELIDHENFIGFGVALTFLTLGVVGTIGSDDILCCFVVGNSLTWDDRFRIDSELDSFQETVDTLLNSAVFIYIGAILPWSSFTEYGLSPWRLVVLGILVMIVRRLPWVVGLYPIIPSLKNLYESVFAGFFGPIGVGAVFYTMVALEKLPEDGTRDHLRDVLLPVNLFLVFTSIVVHGITLPFGKAAGNLLRQIRPKEDEAEINATKKQVLPVTWTASSQIPFAKSGRTTRATSFERTTTQQDRPVSVISERDQPVTNAEDDGKDTRSRPDTPIEPTSAHVSRVNSSVNLERVNGSANGPRTTSVNFADQQ